MIATPTSFNQLTNRYLCKDINEDDNVTVGNIQDLLRYQQY